MTDPSDPPRDEHDLTYERDREESAVEAIVLAVSEATGRSPVEMPPIAGVVSPDAINGLLGAWGDASSVCVSFLYCGKRVFATQGSVRVVDPS